MDWNSMSTTLMTIEDAARHLRVSERTTRKYISDGFLTTVKKSGSRRKWLQSQEVEELRVDKEEQKDGNRMTRAEFLLLKSRVRKLEGHMEVVLRMLDSKNTPLGFNAAYAKTLYDACTSQLRRAKWEPEEIRPWVDIFLRLSEEDLQTVKNSVGSDKPWVPFLRLCLAMTASIVENEKYETSLDLQTLHREIAEGRRRLRVSAMCFADLYSLDMDRTIRISGSPEAEMSVMDNLEKAMALSDQNQP